MQCPPRLRAAAIAAVALAAASCGGGEHAPAPGASSSAPGVSSSAAAAPAEGPPSPLHVVLESKGPIALSGVEGGVWIADARAQSARAAGDADLVAIGREALLDPYWAAHAAQELGADPDFSRWPRQYGWWLDRRRKAGIEAPCPPPPPPPP
ncbi:MAG: hypothetical protein IT372_05105, partial [Polyangiaceae bacterium]|nr:hypothetical protein [Polyangiaceae bacterium]